MNTPPPPDELKKATHPSSLFKRSVEVEVAGVRFVVRRMTLAEELEWYAERDRIMAEDGLSHVEKVVKVWDMLLRRVVAEPKLSSYVEELPTPVVAHLVQVITELHLWNMGFRTSPQASG
ncbi:MAG: hypothetical protein NZ570_08035 [Candidatus Caldarchaeum sp.]|nr:hypothetical protein [Candidatus Caldarchaeum sp.]MCS7137218.1 hypothetical protein [Candidatus Caldarchaeum sp.]MDW7977338.1 hypothetical protein [Candidatus Caldarchaeum sp.]MDW8359669.1 hypothetical protein [Candidatus Caldarchaeum sp.]